MSISLLSGWEMPIVGVRRHVMTSLPVVRRITDEPQETATYRAWKDIVNPLRLRRRRRACATESSRPSREYGTPKLSPEIRAARGMGRARGGSPDQTRRVAETRRPDVYTPLGITPLMRTSFNLTSMYFTGWPPTTSVA